MGADTSRSNIIFRIDTCGGILHLASSFTIYFILSINALESGLQDQFDIIIVGGGIGGCATALRAVQYNMSTLFIVGTKTTRKRSRSQWVLNVDNMIGLHEGIIKEQVLKTLDKAGEASAAEDVRGEHYHVNNRMIIKNTLDRLQDYSDLITIAESEATSAQLVDDQFQIIAGDSTYSAPALIMATGIMDEQPNLPMIDKQGQMQEMPKPIYPFANRETVLYCIRCEGHLTRTECVAVIGSSGTAAEISFMLHERYGNPIYILTNGETANFSDYVLAVVKAYEIEIITDPITGIKAGQPGELCGIAFAEHDPIKIKFGFVALGTHRVYNDLARQLGAQLADDSVPADQQQVLINAKAETSVHNFFVVGDAAVRPDTPTMKQIYTAQEYAVRAVDTADHRRRMAMRERVLLK